MRECPFEGCGKLIPDHLFACGPHWFRLTKEQQTRIWAAYRAYQAGSMMLSELKRIQGDVVHQAQGAKA